MTAAWAAEVHVLAVGWFIDRRICSRNLVPDFNFIPAGLKQGPPLLVYLPKQGPLLLGVSLDGFLLGRIAASFNVFVAYCGFVPPHSPHPLKRRKCL